MRWVAARRRVVGLAVGGLIMVFLGLRVATEWEDVRSFEWRLDLSWLVGGGLALLVFYAASGAGFVRLTELVAERRVDRGRLLDAWSRSLLGRYVPGSVVMVGSRLVLAAEAGVRGRAALAATVYEQVLALGAAALASAAFLAVYGGVGDVEQAWLVLLVVAVGLLALDPKVFAAVSGRALRWAGREPMARFLTRRELLLALGWYLIVAILGALAAWLLLRSAAGPAIGTPLYVGLAFSLAFVLSMAAFIVPSGLGVREGVLALALSRNVPVEVAAALAVGLRVAFTAAELAFIGATAGVARLAGEPANR